MTATDCKRTWIAEPMPIAESETAFFEIRASTIESAHRIRISDCEGRRSS